MIPVDLCSQVGTCIHISGAMSAKRQHLSLEALPAWMSLNDVIFHKVEVQTIERKGNGLVAQQSWLSTPPDNKKDNDEDNEPLVTVPHGLVLNQEAVEEYAKEDRNFRALLDTCGRKNPRHDMLLFLLVHLVVSCQPIQHVALSNPWTEYVKLLDDDVPLPTMWPDTERDLLQGTSLEVSLAIPCFLSIARHHSPVTDGGGLGSSPSQP